MPVKNAVGSKSDLLLLLLGGASLLLYRVGLGADKAQDIGWFINVALVQAAIYLPAVWIVIRTRGSRSTLLIVIAFALLFRLSIVFAPPYLSDDIYRYIWDGRVQAAGINPYRFVPAAPELAALQDDVVYPKINRRDYATTIYPPLVQAIFFLTTRLSESVVWMKLTMLLFEVVAIWAIARLLLLTGLPQERLLIYAWHPLVVWEIAGSGHVDAIAVAFIALAFLAWRRKTDLKAGLALAGATLVKLFPLVFLPVLLKRERWKAALIFAIAIVVAYVPYFSVGPRGALGFLPGYAQEQGLVSGEQFYLLHLTHWLSGLSLPSMAYLVFAVVIMGGTALWVIARRTQNEGDLQSALVLATATTVLFAPHYSWYFVWLIPFLCFVPWVAVFYLTIAGILLYRTWLGDSPDQMFAINSLIYLPFILIGIIEFVWRRRAQTF